MVSDGESLHETPKVLHRSPDGVLFILEKPQVHEYLIYHSKTKGKQTSNKYRYVAYARAFRQA